VEALVRGRQLHVTVMGASVANGCGAGGLPLAQRCDRNATVGLGSVCTSANSWPRWMQEGLASELRLSETLNASLPRSPVIMTVHAKNAVGALHFAHCVRSRVSNQTHIVLLDLAQTSSQGDMHTLFHAVRQSAPWVSIVAPVWVPMRQLGRSEAHSSNDEKALALGVDVVRVDLAAKALLSMEPGVAGPLIKMQCALYDDAVHPSPEGHRLYGDMMARYMARKLLLAQAHPLQAAQSEHGSLTSPAQLPTPWEQCFPDAAQLPVLNEHNSSWRLVDEGAHKHVRKLTLLSDRPGEEVQIGPLGTDGVESCGDARATRHKASPPPGLVRAPNGTTSTAVQVEIGYRISKSWSYGAFRIHCMPAPQLRAVIDPHRGCHCSADPSYWSWQLNPFPVIHTNAHLSRNPHYRDDRFNFTITASVSFPLFIWPANSQCIVQIRHLDSHSSEARGRARGGRVAVSGRVGNKTSVRVDSLSVSCAL